MRIPAGWREDWGEGVPECIIVKERTVLGWASLCDKFNRFGTKLCIFTIIRNNSNASCVMCPSVDHSCSSGSYSMQKMDKEEQGVLCKKAILT